MKKLMVLVALLALGTMIPKCEELGDGDNILWGT